jgi:hypothetical protein
VSARRKPVERASSTAREENSEFAQLSTKFIFSKLASAPSATFQGTSSREELTIAATFTYPAFFMSAHRKPVERASSTAREENSELCSALYQIHIECRGPSGGRNNYPENGLVPSWHVLRKGVAPLSGAEEQTARAFRAYALCTCLLPLQMGSIN